PVVRLLEDEDGVTLSAHGGRGARLQVLGIDDCRGVVAHAEMDRVAAQRVAVARDMRGGPAMAGLARDAELGHTRVGKSVRVVHARLAGNTVAGDAVAVPQPTRPAFCDAWRRDEYGLARHPAAVREQEIERQQIETAAAVRAQPIALLVVRT